jgi:hypothetical protein
MLAPFSVPAGYMLAGLLSCSPQTPPSVAVQFRNNPPGIVNSEPAESLMRLKDGTISPDYGREFSVTGGLTYSNIQTTFDMNFTSSVWPVVNRACLWANNINITVTYTPTVYVASNYRPGSCRYQATLEHEMRHVAADVAFLGELLPYMKEMAEMSVAPWKGAGPVGKETLEAEQAALSKQFGDALEKISDGQQGIRVLRQRQIDTRAEYDRLSTACPAEPSR